MPHKNSPKVDASVVIRIEEQLLKLTSRLDLLHVCEDAVRSEAQVAEGTPKAMLREEIEEKLISSFLLLFKFDQILPAIDAKINAVYNRVGLFHPVCPVVVNPHPMASWSQSAEQQPETIDFPSAEQDVASMEQKNVAKYYGKEVSTNAVSEHVEYRHVSGQHWSDVIDDLAP